MSFRQRSGLSLIVAAALALTVGAPAAQAGKVAEAVFGGMGSTGGLFEGQRGEVTVDQATGQIYVSEGNQRIQRFDAEGNFEIAFGRDVIKAGAPGDLGDAFEICTVAADCKAGVLGTAGAEDHPVGEVTGPSDQLAIDQESGDLYIASLNRRVEKFTIDDNGTPGDPSDDLPIFERAWGWNVVKPGGLGDVTHDEVQEVRIDLPAVSGYFEVGFAPLNPPGFDAYIYTKEIPYNATAVEVQSALEALAAIDPGDVTVTGPAGGPWKLEFSGGAYAGLDVTQVRPQSAAGEKALVGLPQNNKSAAAQARTLDNGGGYEVCTVAAQCRAGSERSYDAGHVSGGSSLAVSPLNGHVFVGAVGRVQEFEPDGDFLRAWGWGVDTGADQLEICTVASGCQDSPRIFGSGPPPNGQFDLSNGVAFGPEFTAIDSAGILYARTREAVLRFDTTAASPAGLLLPLTLTSENPPKGWAEAGWPATGVLPFNNGRNEELAVDPGNDHLYFLHHGGADFGIFEIDPNLDPPARVDLHLEGWKEEDKVGLTGLGYGPGADELYAYASFKDPETNTLQQYRMVRIGNSGPPPPTVLLDPPSGISPHGATLSGEVTPNGPPSISTTYLFEYREAGEPGWSRIALAPIEIGDGGSPVAVTQTFNERQRLRFNNELNPPTGGSFKLRLGLEETAQIPFNASAATLQAALEALPGVGAGNVAVSGGPGAPWTVEFVGELANTDLPFMFASQNNLTPPSGVSSRTITDGFSLLPGADYEAHLVATRRLGAGAATAGPVSFTTTPIPPDVQTLPAQRTEETEATLAGRLNPSNLPTTFRFEYVSEAEFGANGYANALSAPLPEGEAKGSGLRKVAVDVGSLQPQTAYRYRIVATNSKGTSTGDDVKFTTTTAPATTPAARGYEMVTPPFKIVRSAVWPSVGAGNNPNVGIPSLSGETILWKVPYFPLTDEVGAPGEGDKRMIRRNPQLGWVSETVNTLRLLEGEPLLVGLRILAASADFETQPTTVEGGVDLPNVGGLLPTEGGHANRFYTFRKGTGTAGYTPWLTNPEEQLGATHFGGSGFDKALVNDEGTAMVRWALYRGVGENPETPGDEDPSDNETPSGDMLYTQRSADPDLLPTAPKELVNACTGAGATATLVPSLNGSEQIATRECPTKTSTKLTSALGAVAGGREYTQTALSNDGRRIFFESPDPFNIATPTACVPGATGNFTSCPPQLYVRQYDSSGKATVRWISRAQGVGTQNADEMGRGIDFQGASEEGRYVFFKTNAPLLATDPNGGASITNGSASNKSWDLYRYELPASLDADPAGGTLTRISGGPAGTADPGTNGTDGQGAPLRFLSDDGKRAYFLTTAPIAGADESAPAGGSTSPGGAPANTAVRNLYLFDEDAEGAARYRFIARIPFVIDISGTPLGALNFCAGVGGRPGAQLRTRGVRAEQGGANCFRGTPDGSHVIFFSGAQLTPDDNDEAGDIYLYDAEADELRRITVPRADSVPYLCEPADDGEPAALCHGDLGWTTVPVAAGGGGLPELEKARGWAGARYYNVSREADGEVSVYFESRSELLPADTNGEHWDVYRWREGKLDLISPGDSDDHTYFSGNSLDGEDVFLWTSAPIDPREIDPADYDLYDARVGGGFPYTPPPTPCDVLAFECEGEAKPAPPTTAPRSVGFTGPGNPSEGKSCPKGKVLRKGRCVPRPCPKGKVRRKGRCVPKQEPQGKRHSKGHSSKGAHK
jgi:hypothetical protein